MARAGLAADPLFLACTRPALWRGVPLEAVCLNLMASALLLIAAKNPLVLLGGIALHYLTRALTARDPNRFGVLRLWLETKGRARHQARWGGASVSPLPLRPACRAQRLPGLLAPGDAGAADA